MGLTEFSFAELGLVQWDLDELGLAELVLAGLGLALLGLAGFAWLGFAWFSLPGFGLPGFGLPWLGLLSWWACLAGYYYICWRKQGQTLGMKAWRLKLQQLDGSTTSIKQCIKRCIFACFSLSFFGVGYLVCLIPSKKTCLHDWLSETRVVVLEKQKQ